MINYSAKEILIVDDFESFRLSLRRMLISIGIGHIDIVANGKDAIQSCREKQYNAILCDYNLGGGKNGQQILEELQHRGILKNSMLFIMVSAETGREMVLGALEYSPNGYVSKPFTQALLHKRLASFFAQQDALLPINQALDNGDDQKAIMLCKQRSNQPGRYRSWCLRKLAELQIKNNLLDDAKQTCQQLLEGRQQDVPLLLLAQIAMAEREFAQAIALLEELLQHNPQFTRAFDLIAQCQQTLGHPALAQQSLQEAIKISPNFLDRQQSLATLSQQNDDLHTATKAWRSTMTLNQHSCQESPEQYLNFARCLNELSLISDQDNKPIKEALNVVDRARQRFRDSDEVNLQGSLVEAQIHLGQKNTDAAEQALDQARKLYSESPNSATPDIQLEMGKTLLQAGRQKEGEQLLNALVASQHQTSPFKQQVMEILDQPIFVAQRKQAATLNKEGIKKFEAGDFSAAIEHFDSAIKLSSRYPGLNLNLIQAQLKQAGVDGRRDHHYQRSRQALQRLSHLKEDHPQWQRMKHLEQLVNKLAPSNNLHE